MKRLIILPVLAGFFCFATSCHQEKPAAEKTPPLDSLTNINQYTCPMHPEVITDTAGNCTKCGMELHLKS